MMRIAILVAGSVLVAATLGGQAPAAPKPGRLVAFTSCPALLHYAKSHVAPFVTAYGVGRASPGPLTPAPAAKADSGPQQGVDYSGTNVQEQGVDEPDLVKTNGSTLFAVENGELEAVRVDNGKPKLLDTLALGGGWSRDLLLSGNHLLVLSRGGGWLEPLPAQPAMMIAPVSSGTTLTEVDVSDPTHLQVVRTLTIDGAYLDARQIGSTVRLVTSTALPIAVPTVTPSGTDAGAWRRCGKEPRRRRLLARLGLAPELPARQARGPAARLVPRRSPSGRLLGARNAHGLDDRAREGSCAGRLDRDHDRRAHRLCLAHRPVRRHRALDGAGRGRPRRPSPLRASDPDSRVRHLGRGEDRLLGSGSVAGYLLSQWSLSEFGSVLRVVSTDAPAWWSGQPTASRT